MNLTYQKNLVTCLVAVRLHPWKLFNFCYLFVAGAISRLPPIISLLDMLGSKEIQRNCKCLINDEIAPRK